MLKLRSDPSGKRSDLLRRERGRSEVRLEVGATEYEATMDSLAAAPSRVDMAVARLKAPLRGCPPMTLLRKCICVAEK